MLGRPYFRDSNRVAGFCTLVAARQSWHYRR